MFVTAGTLLNLVYSTFLGYPIGLAAKEKMSLGASIVNTSGSFGVAFAPFVVGLILDTLDRDWVFRFLAAVWWRRKPCIGIGMPADAAPSAILPSMDRRPCMYSG
jgi:hypothetical protein